MRTLRGALLLALIAGLLAGPARAADPLNIACCSSTGAGPATRSAKTDAAGPVAPAPPAEAMCGHRSMNGRTCTRERDHAAKSHRYS